MAKRTNKYAKKGRAAYENNDVVFASRRLSRQEGEDFVEWYKSSAPPFEDALCKINNDLYKIGFKVDLNNSANVISFTQQDERHPHYNVYLTSRSDDPIEAFFMNCFKVWVIYADKPIETDEQLNELWG